MSIRVKTDAPSDLIEAIDEAISDGLVESWTVDDDGDYSLTNPDWSSYGWMTPSTRSGDEIVFNVLGVQNRDMTIGEYALLHSEFLYILLNNFDSKFFSATISAGADGDDSL
jgi:hypothetical protein